MLGLFTGLSFFGNNLLAIYCRIRPMYTEALRWEIEKSENLPVGSLPHFAYSF